MKTPTSVNTSNGFSLVELLTVMAIMGVFATAVMSGGGSVVTGVNLSGTTGAFVDEVSHARQLALARNRSVQLRLYLRTGNSGNSYFDQTATVLAGNTPAEDKFVSVGRPFPVGILGESDPALSTIAGLPRIREAATAPEILRGRDYIAIELKANGATGLSTSAASTWTMVFRPEHGPASSSGSGPSTANYIAVVIDPLTGRTLSFQP